ncbi:hypothetical protein [Intrasporangium sp.]|uniref:hypothetical protein n=1 Tax=Intrasporangium sp. TaxID=1925024 RepID=UPI0033655F55
MTRLTAEPAPDGLVSDRGSAFSNDTGEPIVRIVAGRVGENVKRVTVHTKEQGDVVATVRNGYFAAWWPGETFEVSTAPTAPLSMEFSFTAGLIDGSTREFSRPPAPPGE